MPLILFPLLAFLVWSSPCVAAFQCRTAAVSRPASLATSPFLSLTALRVKGEGEDFPADDVEYKGDVDWDAEWKKVVEKQKAGESVGDRPGKDFYKTDVERAAIKSMNTVVERVNKAADSVPKVQAPNIRSLQGDWKFWIAILVIISVGTSLLAASGPSPSAFTSDPSTSDPSSYYI